MRSKRFNDLRTDQEVLQMKNTYLAPVVSVTRFNTEDVITLSNYGVIFDFESGRKDAVSIVMDPADGFDMGM